jgi:hypothetical protein
MSFRKRYVTPINPAPEEARLTVTVGALEYHSLRTGQTILTQAAASYGARCTLCYNCETGIGSSRFGMDLIRDDGIVYSSALDATCVSVRINI